jgi:hypothetical protein
VEPAHVGTMHMLCWLCDVGPAQASSRLLHLSEPASCFGKHHAAATITCAYSHACPAQFLEPGGLALGALDVTAWCCHTDKGAKVGSRIRFPRGELGQLLVGVHTGHVDEALGAGGCIT